LHAAVQSGAKVLKLARKGLFGGFSGVYQAPDGAIWKLAAPTKKDTGPAGEPPLPTETGAILGVAEPKVSKVFYEALGMTVDRDYGSKFVDFTLTPGTCRFGLMPRKALAKDAGVGEDGAGFRAAVLKRRAESREEVDAVLTAAVCRRPNRRRSRGDRVGRLLRALHRPGRLPVEGGFRVECLHLGAFSPARLVLDRRGSRSG
jgi:hypothetical protein